MQSLKENINSFNREYGKVFFVVICGVGIILTSIFIYVTSTPQKLKVSFLDIGQGDAILIQTPSGQKLLIDGGPTNIILDRIYSQISFFDHTMDVMVSTHPDADHVTGLIPILEKFNVNKIITSSVPGDTGIFKELESSIQNENSETHIGNAGDILDFHDGVTATILHPYNDEKFKDTNEGSVTLLLKYGDETFLLDGDLPTTKEPLILTSLLPHNITVYKAGHHGSKYSSGEQLLTYIKPEYSVISAGKDNKYGHPNLEAMERLQKYSKEIISTIDRGTISFITDGKIIEVNTTK
ncbi:MAG: internalization-like protein competence protein ComEC/Rec2, competence protein ComEC protein [Candidatus Nomurabacteria bacterium]|nr:internalization-like protein competence protein ComEC/Rec2, competence protein ComEC protein [Candidatus Nomurabacteria bacterium]